VFWTRYSLRQTKDHVRTAFPPKSEENYSWTIPRFRSVHKYFRNIEGKEEALAPPWACKRSFVPTIPRRGWTLHPVSSVRAVFFLIIRRPPREAMDSMHSADPWLRGGVSRGWPHMRCSHESSEGTGGQSSDSIVGRGVPDSRQRACNSEHSNHSRRNYRCEEGAESSGGNRSATGRRVVSLRGCC